MAKLHVDELEITTNLVLQLLKKQSPQWANLSLQPISSSGTDNALFRLGDDLVVRLPKIDWAAESIYKEYEWMPQLTSYLKMAISAPIFEGKPDGYYPWPWMIVRWNDGINPSFEKGDEYATLAKDLATFLNELHRIPLKNGPLSRRGASLKIVDDANALSFPDNTFDVVTAERLLICFEDPLPILKEMVRVLKPGGVLVITDFDPASILITPADDTMHQTFMDIYILSFADKFIGRKLPMLFKKAGLTILDVLLNNSDERDITHLEKIIPLQQVLEGGIRAGYLSQEQAHGWQADMHHASKEGIFLYAITVVSVLGRK